VCRRGGNEMQVGIVWRMVEANCASCMVVLGVSFVKVHEGYHGTVSGCTAVW